LPLMPSKPLPPMLSSGKRPGIPALTASPASPAAAVPKSP
jgi:hypothetical protein